MYPRRSSANAARGGTDTGARLWACMHPACLCVCRVTCGIAPKRPNIPLQMRMPVCHLGPGAHVHACATCALKRARLSASPSVPTKAKAANAGTHPRAHDHARRHNGRALPRRRITAMATCWVMVSPLPLGCNHGMIHRWSAIAGGSAGLLSVSAACSPQNVTSDGR